MALAKATAIFGGSLYLAIFFAQVFFARAFFQFFSNDLGIQNRTFFALVLAALFLAAVINFCYSYFLVFFDKHGEKIKSALFYSLQLLVFPAILFAVGVALFVTL